MHSGHWIPLDQATDPARFGNKAAQLARLAGAGFSVIPGWVLDLENTRRLIDDPEFRTARAIDLKDIQRDSDWHIRSSSPSEDRPGASAAGLFLTLQARPRTEPIADALLAVAESAASAAEVLGEEAECAILAQEFLDLAQWCTLELTGVEWRLEGLSQREGHCRFDWMSECRPTWEALVALGLRAAENQGVDPALLELGSTRNAIYVLQLRPAPTRKPAILKAVSPIAHELPGLGLHVHLGDEESEWIADHAHCPRPLCPLLAGLFGERILHAPAASMSRLYNGIWHDRKPITDRPVPDVQEVESLTKQWSSGNEHLSLTLVRVSLLAKEIDGTLPTWRTFTKAWLNWQNEYYQAPSGECRRWAREKLADGFQAGELPGTIAKARLSTWTSLRSDIQAFAKFAQMSAPTLDNWAKKLMVEELVGDYGGTGSNRTSARSLADRIRFALEESAHLTALAYDGRGVTFGEDPILFWREIAALRGNVGVGRARRSDDAERRLALTILAAAEDDNDRLLKAYEQWRKAVRLLADLRGYTPSDDLLDLLPEDLDRWLETSPGTPLPPEALARGRALRAFWDLPETVKTSGSELSGLAAAPGRCTGKAVCAHTLAEIPPEKRDVAVVTTLTPSDGLLVPQFRAIVCEAGEVLGHASVLAREYAVACVVNVTDARSVLEHQPSVLVDGDTGIVRILPDFP